MSEKIEFHCHTSNSFDCSDSLEDKIQIYRNLGFNKVYITDHDKVLSNDYITSEIRPGIEISSTFGHIILLECKKKPILNTLWFIVLWSKLNRSTILLPHPFRKYTGILERYRIKGFSQSYLNWFLRKVHLIEHYNHRDKKIIELDFSDSTLSIIKKINGVYASDSHTLADIYEPGTLVRNGEILKNDSLSHNFFNNLLIKKQVFKFKRFPSNIYNFLLSVRRSTIYITYGNL